MAVTLLSTRRMAQATLDLSMHFLRRQATVETRFREERVSQRSRTAKLRQVRGRGEQQAMPVADRNGGAVPDGFESLPVQSRGTICRAAALHLRLGLGVGLSDSFLPVLCRL